MQTGKIGFGAMNSTAQETGMIIGINHLCPDKTLRGTKIFVKNSAPKITAIMKDRYGKVTGLLADPTHIITNYVDDAGKPLSKKYKANTMIPHLDLLGWVQDTRENVINNLKDFVVGLVDKHR